jgi:hypothetical protein
MASYQWNGAIPPGILGDTFTSTTRVSAIKPDGTLGPYTTWKTVAKVVATSNVTTTGVQTVDSVLLAVGDKVLLTNQTSAINNGLYIVDLNAWQLAPDFPLGSDAAGLTVLINQGTINADTVYVCTNAIGAGIVGTNNLTFSYLTGLNGVTGPATSVNNSVPVFNGTNGHVLADNTLVTISGGVLTAASGLTATAGNVVATAGNVVATVGNVTGVGLQYSSKGSYNQATNTTTDVPITTNAGTVTTQSFTLAVNTSSSFHLTGSVILSTSQIMLTKVSYSGIGGTNGVPEISVASVSAGTATITVSNYSTLNALAGTLTFNYIIV